MFAETANNHRFERKQMTPEEKEEYIKKCKDYQFYKVKNIL